MNRPTSTRRRSYSEPPPGDINPLLAMLIIVGLYLMFGLMAYLIPPAPYHDAPAKYHESSI